MLIILQSSAQKDARQKYQDELKKQVCYVCEVDIIYSSILQFLYDSTNNVSKEET